MDRLCSGTGTAPGRARRDEQGQAAAPGLAAPAAREGPCLPRRGSVLITRYPGPVTAKRLPRIIPSVPPSPGRGAEQLQPLINPARAGERLVLMASGGGTGDESGTVWTVLCSPGPLCGGCTREGTRDARRGLPVGTEPLQAAIQPLPTEVFL